MSPISEIWANEKIKKMKNEYTHTYIYIYTLILFNCVYFSFYKFTK